MIILLSILQMDLKRCHVKVVLILQISLRNTELQQNPLLLGMQSRQLWAPIQRTENEDNGKYCVSLYLFFSPQKPIYIYTSI